MKLVKALTYHKCKRGCDIWSGDHYYPQRRGKALCLYCGKPRVKSFIGKLLGLVA
jgi:hypothetical protein